MNESKLNALKSVDSNAERLNKLANDIWDNPEICYTEVKSSGFQKEALREFGFEVEENLANIPTAFKGTFGKGRPVIGFLGEFDALSGMSQKADMPKKEAVTEGGNGHGCGHNLLGTASIGAALAVKNYLLETGHEGTVVYFGCPAEEGGSGKTFMARDKVFDDLDLAISWHPGDTTVVVGGSMLANIQVNYKFTGRAAHAAACPHLGRSALDACELMNVGVQFLREHIIPEAKVHYAITDTGGISPNVVQPQAQVLYLIRAPKNSDVEEIKARVDDIAKGAALMTGTSVDIEFIKACSNVVPNRHLAEIMQRNIEELPYIKYTDEEYAYAQEIKDTIEDMAVSIDKFISQMKPEDKEIYKGIRDKAVYDKPLPLIWDETPLPASSDVGDVSWVCPTIQCTVATMAANTPGHSWQLVTQGKSSLAHKGMLQASKIMASTAIDLLNSPEDIRKAREEWADRVGNKPFESPIPMGVVPKALKKLSK